MNNVIIVEDNDAFVDEFTQESCSKNINITHKKSFEGLEEILPKYENKYAAVILDIKCLLKDDQEIENANFIGIALSYLDRNVTGFPRYILTGDDTEFENMKKYHSTEKIFLKTPDGIKLLFSELQNCVENSEDLKIKRCFKPLFNIFKDDLMNYESEKILLKIIKDGLEENDPSNFKGILGNIRSLQEKIYKFINLKNKSIVPDDKFKSNGMVRFRPLMKHLNGNPDRNYNPTTQVYQNNTIGNISNAIYWGCGEYLHEEVERFYEISNYTIKSLIYGLFELLLWAKPYLK